MRSRPNWRPAPPAAHDRLQAPAGQDLSAQEAAQRRPASAAIVAGAALGAIADAERSGELRARRALSMDVLRHVTRAAKRKREAGDVSPVDQHLNGAAVSQRLRAAHAALDLPAAWRLNKKTERAARRGTPTDAPATCRASTSRDSRVHPGQRELLARRARLLLGELGTGGAPTRLAPVPHDLPGGGVPPPGRRAQRPEVDLSVCDLQDLAIHAPALDPSEHEIAHGNPLELHRSHSARSRSASFCVAPEGSVEPRRAPARRTSCTSGAAGREAWEADPSAARARRPAGTAWSSSAPPAAVPRGSGRRSARTRVRPRQRRGRAARTVGPPGRPIPATCHAAWWVLWA